MSEVETALHGALRQLQHPGDFDRGRNAADRCRAFTGRECFIKAMPAEVHYDGGSEPEPRSKG
jgi:hypothetical protein